MTPPVAAPTRPVELWQHGRTVHCRGAGMSAGCSEPIWACEGWAPVHREDLDLTRVHTCPTCLPHGLSGAGR